MNFIQFSVQCITNQTLISFILNKIYHHSPGRQRTAIACPDENKSGYGNERPEYFLR